MLKITCGHCEVRNFEINMLFNNQHNVYAACYYYYSLTLGLCESTNDGSSY